MRKSLERVLFMCVGGVLVLLGGAFLPQNGQVNAQNRGERVFDTIICRELKVVDALGRVRAGLGSDEKGGFVTVFGKNKEGIHMPVVAITENEGGGSIFMLGKDRKSAVGLSIQEHIPGRFGGFIMVKNDESQYNSITNITRGAISIHAAENGGGVAVFNNAGNNVVILGVSNTGSGALRTGDKYGNETGSVP